MQSRTQSLFLAMLFTKIFKLFLGVLNRMKMFGEEFPCLYYVLMSYFFEKCRASQTKMVLKKSWSTSNLVTRHLISDSPLLFSGVFRTIIASLSSLRHYFAFDSGLDKINSMAQQILLGHPVMHWTRQQLRGGHKREAFANRVMDTHARASRPKKNLEYKINFRAQKRWENRTHTF